MTRIDDIVIGTDYQIDYDGEGTDTPRRVRALDIRVRPGTFTSKVREVVCAPLTEDGMLMPDTEQVSQRARDLTPWDNWWAGYKIRRDARLDAAQYRSRLGRLLGKLDLSGLLDVADTNDETIRFRVLDLDQAAALIETLDALAAFKEHPLDSLVGRTR